MTTTLNHLPDTKPLGEFADNLRVAGQGLIDLVLPEGARFDMRDFGSHEQPKKMPHGLSPKTMRETVQNCACGTVGCALGWIATMPLAEGIVEKEYYWNSFSRRLFGFSTMNAEQWDWCFGTEWFSRDNTPRGAGLRILYMVENGVPENYRLQQRDRAPLCYQHLLVPRPQP